MALRDYLDWHHDYDRPGSRLHLRLLAVRDLVAEAIDALPQGPIRVISICAGQGRDLITVASRHRRGHDLQGVLVELDDRNVALANGTLAAAGVSGLTAIQADASNTAAYQGHVPADLLLFCGVFGNISDDDLAFTITNLPSLCAPGAWAIWTGYPRDGSIATTLEKRFTAAGFTPRSLIVSDEIQLGVGAAVLDATPRPFEPGIQLFEFCR